MSNPYFDILASEANLRNFLSKLKEFEDFDNYVLMYVEDCLGHRIIRRPAKGRYGEQGKDFVAIDDENNLTYCSCIIKAGNLDKNLDGPYGIIISLEKAMSIELEENEYKAKPRTAIVVYNGVDGSRSAPARFEKIKNEIEEKATMRGILSKQIERWDVSHFSKRLYNYKNKLHEKEFFRRVISAMSESIKIIETIKETFPSLGIDESAPKSPAEELLMKVNKDIIHLEDKYGIIEITKQK